MLRHYSFSWQEDQDGTNKQAIIEKYLYIPTSEQVEWMHIVRSFEVKVGIHNHGNLLSLSCWQRNRWSDKEY